MSPIANKSYCDCECVLNVGSVQASLTPSWIWYNKAMYTAYRKNYIILQVIYNQYYWNFIKHVDKTNIGQIYSNTSFGVY